MPADLPLQALAEQLTALSPSCGPVRLVGVDGHAGSGKTTFAGQLAGALGGAPVLHLDDLASHGALFGWTARLTRQVLEPLERGESARYEVYDWVRRTYAAHARLPAAPVVLVEGVGAGRRELRPYLACLLWLETPREESWARGQRRDGEAQRAFWAGWVRAERAHFAADPSRPFANHLVRTGPETYEVLPGPAGRASGGPSPHSP